MMSGAGLLTWVETMPLSDHMLILVAVAGGVAFSAIGWAYRAAAGAGIPTCHVAVGMGLAGVAWFGWRAFGTPDAPGVSAPPLVWIWGVANGLAQGCCVYLYQAGLRYGPFAPLWCAGNLSFVTPAVFALWFLGESLDWTQGLAMASAALCVVAAAMGQRRSAENGLAGGWKSWTIYPAMLCALVIFTGLCGAGLKHLAAVRHGGVPLNPMFNDCFMLGMYAALLAWVAVESALHGERPISRGRAFACAAAAGAGSVTGMTLTALVSRLPGGTGFAVISVCSVLAGSLVTSFGFGERRTGAWWVTVGLAAVSVVLFHLSSGG